VLLTAIGGHFWHFFHFTWTPKVNSRSSIKLDQEPAIKNIEIGIMPSRQRDLSDRIKGCSAHFAKSPVRRKVVGIDSVPHFDLPSVSALGADGIDRRIFKVRRVEALCH
jgi:hypothetical protein